MANNSSSKKRQPLVRGDEAAVRQRILDAAFDAFKTNGYGASSTLEIATRARVSKRELYARVGNKEKILITAITERAKRLQVPTDLPVPQDRETFRQVLTGFGTQLVREVTDPAVVAVFRLAIAEVTHAPEVAQALDSIGRHATRVAIRGIMTRAVAAKLIDGNPADLSAEFGTLLFGDFMVSMLLGVAERPTQKKAAQRAERAVEAFMTLHQ